MQNVEPLECNDSTKSPSSMFMETRPRFLVAVLNNNLSIKIMQSSVPFQLEALFLPLRQDKSTRYFQDESSSPESVRFLIYDVVNCEA